MTMIKFDHVSLEYGRDPVTILDDLSFSVASQEFVVLLGANGSGKSSLMKYLTRKYVPTSGKVLFCGEDIQKVPHKICAVKIKKITQQLEDSLFYDLTVLENAHVYHTSKAPEDISLYLCKYNKGLAGKLHVPVYKLSGGEKQALIFALCLEKKPDLLLLDEHTRALDPKAADQIIAQTNTFIAENNLTAIMTTHNVGHALKYGSRILALRGGKIGVDIAGEKKKALTQKELISICY